MMKMWSCVLSALNHNLFVIMPNVSPEDEYTWCRQARIRVCLGQSRGTTHCSIEDAEQYHQTLTVLLTQPTTPHEPRHAVTDVYAC